MTSSSQYLLALHDLNDSFFILNISPSFGGWLERVKQCELMRLSKGGEDCYIVEGRGREVCYIEEGRNAECGIVERSNKRERERDRVVEQERVLCVVTEGGTYHPLSIF